MMDLVRKATMVLAAFLVVFVVLVVFVGDETPNNKTLILIGAIGGIILSLFVLIGFALQSEYSLELKKETEVEERKSPVIRAVPSPNDDQQPA
ncbi:MAG: hypothetical protein A2W51_02820 [Candidatus Zambryskibacteria bacterium RIFCSPHIGHO2_02_39_10]|nr:MAG: hypothetical protein A2W51_02820 [Candidatus Zambryskibacteria bacterium RIFCSPHIGHO2_02_39_10]